MSENDELAAIVKRRVESEVTAVRENIEKEMKTRLVEIEKDFNKAYRVKIIAVLSGIVALLIAGALTSTLTATRQANEAVIAFQNAIIDRQKSVMQTEDTVTLLLGKVTDARDKVSKAASDMDIASDKLKSTEERLKTAEEKLKITTDALNQAKRDYDELSRKQHAGK
ncbi:MAG TPA: hypothetical protein VHA33_21515 [Candidatus Angelobacter sp.]|jgi:uncharacterized phage infection (PIP) family protein YhgE|nr:hypothetical protein [Candidatus Angelobacter sp.]